MKAPPQGSRQQDRKREVSMMDISLSWMKEKEVGHRMKKNCVLWKITMNEGSHTPEKKKTGRSRHIEQKQSRKKKQILPCDAGWIHLMRPG